MDADILDEFVLEGWSLLDRVEAGLRRLAEDSSDATAIGEMRTALRHLTGSAGFLGLLRLAGLSHALGRRLTRCLDEEQRLPLAATRTATALVRDILAGLEATRSEPVGNDAALILRLESEDGLADQATEETRLEEPQPDDAEYESCEGSPLLLRAATVDDLLDLVSELDHTRNELLEIVIEEPASRFTLPVSELDRVTSALEDFVLERITPVEDTGGISVEGHGEPVVLEAPDDPTTTSNSNDDELEELREVAAEFVAGEGTPDVGFASGVPEAEMGGPGTVQPSCAPRPDSPDATSRLVEIGDTAADASELEADGSSFDRDPATTGPNASDGLPAFDPTDGVARRSVLVVDDSLLYRQLALATLERGEFDVVTATSADEAIELLAGGCRFDVIVSDIEMPGTDGRAFAEWLRSRAVGESAWLVALTSLDASHVPRLLAAGFDRYVHKFHAGTLLRAIAAADTAIADRVPTRAAA